MPNATMENLLGVVTTGRTAIVEQVMADADGVLMADADGVLMAC